MAGPKAKKSKLSPNNSVNHFTENGEAHDRVLLVEKTKFHVQSEKLVQHSEYFRIMFSSDFVEKDKETIQLKEFKAKQIKMFLEVLFKPDAINVNEENIAALMELFVFFQAVDSLVDFFKAKKVFNIISNEEFLNLAARFGSNEFKNFAEDALIEQLVKKSRLRKKKLIARDFKFDDLVLNGLKLSNEHKMIKLKDHIDSQLALEFSAKVHFHSVDAKYIELLEQYTLIELTKSVETHAIGLIRGDVNDVISRFLSNKVQIETKELKQAVESCLITKFDTRYESANRLDRHLSSCKLYGFQEFKEKISVFVNTIYETDNRDISTINQADVVDLAMKYGLEPIRSDQQKLLVTKFNINKNKFSEFIPHLVKYDLPELKDAVEEHILSKFNKEAKNDGKIVEFSKNSADCQMEKLKSLIDTYFVDQFHLNHSFKYIKLAFDYKMEKFQNILSDFLNTANFDDPFLIAGREHIVTLSAEHQSFVLCCILRKPNIIENTSIFS